MFWNCEANFICDAPNGAMNWAVGSVGSFVNAQYTKEPDGIIQSTGTHVTPRSLYYKQLQERLGPNGLRHMILPQQKTGAIYAQLQSWNGEGLLLDRVITWVDETSVPVPTNFPLSVGGFVRDLSLLDASPTTYQWSQVSGPGTTTFSSSSNLSTTASFSLAGTYTLQLVVTSSKGSSATATLTTNASLGPIPNPTPDPIPNPTLALSSNPTPAPCLCRNATHRKACTNFCGINSCVFTRKRICKPK
jgi:hypothetical protein